MGIRVHSEVCTSDGRVDSLVETDNHVVILEFKLDESPQTALDQIKRKKYYQAYWLKNKKIIGIGVNFSSTTKNIDQWLAEEIA
jgi:RecB family endonuclease NucS